MKHNPKSRPKTPPDKPSGTYIGPADAVGPWPLMPELPKPTCGTCGYYEPVDKQGGTCFGVEPVALMKLDGSTVGAFPPVKVTSRCPNWRGV